jgi:hypothetical protein
MPFPHACSPGYVHTVLSCLTLLFGAAKAADYHVATDGSDGNPGTRELPFASIHQAQRKAEPGDTVYIRGGTYHMRESDIARNDGRIACLIALDKSGRKDRPIRYFASPGERPVFDCSKVTPDGLRVSAFRIYGSWIHLKGLEITGVRVNSRGHTQSISVDNLGNHNIFEQLSMHDSEAIGLYITRGNNNTVLNCDAYRNHDRTSEDRRGGNTDGFGCHPRNSEGENNVFKGCRAWFNSDDGFDCINAPDAVTFINCWAFYNGYSPDFEPLADGNGFKTGGYGIKPGTRFPDPVPVHRVIGCLAVRNRSSGFYANHHPGGVEWIHNSASGNGANFNFLGRNPEGTSDIPGRGHKIINNLSYNSKRDVTNLDPQLNQRAGNSFDHEHKLESRNFLSLDESELTAPRQANGELPTIKFLRLVEGNPLTNTAIPNDVFPARRHPGAL